MDANKIEKIFNKHKAENYRRLKIRGKTSKERLANEIKTMSKIRKNVAKMEQSVMDTLSKGLTVVNVE